MFRFDHIGITALDLDSTIRFYSVLGFNIMKSWTNKDRNMKACMMKNERNECIEIFYFKDYIPSPVTVGSQIGNDSEAIEADLPQIGIKHLAFRVNDLDETLALLQTEGLCDTADIMDGGLGNRYMFIRDPNGIFVEFMENPYIKD